MTATTTVPALHAPYVTEADGRWLAAGARDRLFLVGSVVLVPIPILAFLLLSAAGLDAGVSGDLVSLLVMVPLGGPHVYATFARTFMTPRFWREERFLVAASLLVFAVVVLAAVTSAFFDLEIRGAPPMRYVLTFFFFWAGVHVAHQHAHVIAVLRPTGTPGRDRLGCVDYLLVLIALYPVALFRMSMADTHDPTLATADADALATRIVLALGGSREFADDYVFRIGHVSPILPDFLLHPTCWIAATLLFAACSTVFAWRSWRAHRAGLGLGLRFWLVALAATAGALVPLVPHLDSAFQGINAWHCCQYLGIVWLASRATGFGRAAIRPLRFYGGAVLATLGLMAVILALAAVISAGSGGEFALLGHDVPPRDASTGRLLYRPGSILLAYYLLGFSVLLVHYFVDGSHLFRRRQLLGA